MALMAYNMDELLGRDYRMCKRLFAISLVAAALTTSEASSRVEAQEGKAKKDKCHKINNTPGTEKIITIINGKEEEIGGVTQENFFGRMESYVGGQLGGSIVDTLVFILKKKNGFMTVNADARAPLAAIRPPPTFAAGPAPRN